MRTTLTVVCLGALALGGCGGSAKETGEEAGKPAPAQSAAASGRARESAAIPGMAASSVERYLGKTWGITFTPPKPGAETAVRQASATVRDGVRLSAILSGGPPGGVRTVACQILGQKAPAVQAVADLLASCAALPYTGSRPAEAGQWVTRLAARPSRGGGHETTIGGVQYNLAVDRKHNLWVLSMAAQS